MFLSLVGPLTARTVDRDEDLSGAQENMEPKAYHGLDQEPQRQKAGHDQKRPTLKLPEVIVKGEKQYRVSAEKKDLLDIDPMKETKDVPVDLSKVAIPGLTDEKNSPQSATVTSKNYVLRVESLGGNHDQLQDEVIAGYENNLFDAVLRSQYQASSLPEAFGFIPFDQKADLALNNRFKINPQWQLSLDLEGDTSAHRNPPLAQSTGDWVRDQNGGVTVKNKIELNPQTLVNLDLAASQYRLYTGPWHLQGNQLRRANVAKGHVDVDLMVPFLNERDLNVLAEGTLTSQALQETYPADQPHALDERFSTIKVHARYQPLAMITLDLGVKLDQLNRTLGVIADQNVIGGLDLVFPWGTTLYTRLDGGLNWISAQDLIPEPHRITWQSLTTTDPVQPEKLKQQLELGWRQKVTDDLTLDLSWEKKAMDHHLVWTNETGLPLFSFHQIDQVDINQAAFNLQFHPQGPLSLEMGVDYHQSAWGSARQMVPYLPLWQGHAGLTWKNKPWTISLLYHYSDEVSALLSDPEVKLKAAHLLGLKANYQVTSMLDVLLEMNNLLSYDWEQWRGYPEPGLSLAAGLRMTF